MRKKGFSKKFPNIIKAISCFDFVRILDIEFRTFDPDRYDELMEKAKYMMVGSRDIDQLDYLRSILPLDKIHLADETPGRIPEYTALTHHVWITNLTSRQDDDLKVYKKGEHTVGTPEALKRLTTIDDPENFFIQSCFNIDKGAKNSKLSLSEDGFYHIIWTNMSRDEMHNNPQLKSLRKIYNIDESSVELPNFVVLNVNDIMDQDISSIKDLAHPDRPLPRSIFKGLQNTKKDLLSVRNQLEEMRQKHLVASTSDVIRAIAMKDMGGLYFDFDQEIFDQDKVHNEQKKYNLFDLMKNYNVILGKEYNDFCSNGFLSAAQPNASIMLENWNLIYRNITIPETIEYIKYNASGGQQVICQTGPTPITLAFIKNSSMHDFTVPPSKLIHDEQLVFTRDQSYIESDLGIIGRTISSGTWAIDADKLFGFAAYNTDTGEGITAEQLAAMVW